MMIEFVLWLTLAYFLMGLAEYVIHRRLMHKRVRKTGYLNDIWFDHAILHHREDDNTQNIDLSVWHHLIIGSPLLAFLAWFNPIALVATLVVFYYHSWMWTSCHRAIHNVKRHWIERTPIYRIIKRHHEGHHEHPNKNFNVVMVWPFSFDRIFGTKV